MNLVQTGRNWNRCIYLWYKRNPRHDINSNSGEDLFWKTAFMVFEDYVRTVSRNDRQQILNMENEEKKAAFIKQAQVNKENFDLHQKLIEKHFGKVEDRFLLTAMAYSEEYAALRQPLVSGELCRCTGIMYIEKVNNVVWCRKCRKKFLAA